ncbi:hypothetical protein SE17_34350, partial [Kouleothrix aurantiaca]
RTPITCGLHVPDLTEDLGLRANDIFAEVDIPAIHGYPMYADWSTGPLDSDFVPFLCALTSALCGKPTLMEEFGGCTEAPGMPSTTWSWTAYGQPREQFMASEEEMAGYLAEVLPKLVEVGATGAMLWCYADYAPELWRQPPLDRSARERTLGLVDAQGREKPAAAALRAFAAERRPVLATRPTLDVDPERYWRAPARELARLWREFIAG